MISAKAIISLVIWSSFVISIYSVTSAFRASALPVVCWPPALMVWML